MRELSDDVLEEIQAVCPCPADTERPDPIPDEFVWVRPPSTTRGTNQTLSHIRGGVLTIDVWAKRVVRLHEILDTLVVIHDGRFENGRAQNIHYLLESETFDEEADTYHYIALFSFTYQDGRLLSG